MARIDNRLLTMAPAEVTEVELAIEDFHGFRENWALAMPEEKYDMLRSIMEKVCGHGNRPAHRDCAEARVQACSGRGRNNKVADV